MSKMISKRRTVGIVAMCLMLLFSAFATMDVNAATKKTAEKSMVAMGASELGSSATKAIDKMEITYNSNKVVSGTFSQTNAGVAIFPKGGITVASKSNDKWTIKSVWYVDLKKSTDTMKKKGKKITSDYETLCKLGKIAKVETTYTVTNAGKVTRKSCTGKVLTDSKYASSVKKVVKALVKNDGAYTISF